MVVVMVAVAVAVAVEVCTHCRLNGNWPDVAPSMSTTTLSCATTCSTRDGSATAKQFTHHGVGVVSMRDQPTRTCRPVP